jgi:hypothetical protein
MPQQRLQFSPKVVRRSIQTTSFTGRSHNDSAAPISGSPTPLATEATLLSPSLVSTPPLQSLPMKQRTSWVFRHMPDPDTQTNYYNKDNREEWRRRTIEILELSKSKLQWSKLLPLQRLIPKSADALIQRQFNKIGSRSYG